MGTTTSSSVAPARATRNPALLSAGIGIWPAAMRTAAPRSVCVQCRRRMRPLRSLIAAPWVCVQCVPGQRATAATRRFGGRGLNQMRQPQEPRAASSVSARYWRDLPLARLPRLMHASSAYRRASWHPGRIRRRLQALVAVTPSHHERQARVVVHHAGQPVPGAWNRRTPACVRTSHRTRPDLAFIAFAHGGAGMWRALSAAEVPLVPHHAPPSGNPAPPARPAAVDRA